MGDTTKSVKPPAIVQVAAQVMVRDEEFGCWVPLDTGGLSYVTVLRQSDSSFLISGHKIRDRMAVLKCFIQKDFQYNKIMPTFHHWRTGSERYGLIFNTAHDANAFYRAVREAIGELLKGTGQSVRETGTGYDEILMTLRSPVKKDRPLYSNAISGRESKDDGYTNLAVPARARRRTSSPALSPSRRPPDGVKDPLSPTTEQLTGLRYSQSSDTNDLLNHWNHKNISDKSYQNPVTEDDVFMILDLPASNNSDNGKLHSMGFSTDSRGEEDSLTKSNSDSERNTCDSSEKVKITSKDNYVHFSKESGIKNDYAYPSVKDLMFDPAKLKPPPPLPPMGGSHGEVLSLGRPLGGHKKASIKQCEHCLQMYTDATNKKGSCDYAPNPAANCIDSVSCISGAQCMLYHCVADDEEDFEDRPCGCRAASPQCAKQWLGLVLLSFFLPCLCLYPPLRACYFCGKTLGICGGRHNAGKP